MEALRSSREGSGVQGQAYVLNDLSKIALGRGELEKAQSYAQKALGLFREMNAPEGQAEALRELGTIAQQTGDLVLAASYLQEALTIFQAIGAKLEVAKTEELLRKVQAQVAAA